MDFPAKEKIIGSRSMLVFCIAQGIPNQISFLLQHTDRVNRVQKIAIKLMKHLDEVIHCASLGD